MAPSEPSILVVDDTASVAAAHADIVTSLGYRAVVCTDPLRAVEMTRQAPGLFLVLLDLRMPALGGLDLLGQLTAEAPWLGVVVVTVIADTGEAVRCVRAGAFNYLLKPLTRDRLEAVLRAYDVAHRSPTRRPAGPFPSSHRLTDPLVRRAAIYAGTGAPVLVEAEPGAGASHVARLIHSRSPTTGFPAPGTRASRGRFVEVDLSTVGPTHVAPIVFGRPGKEEEGALALAAGGTLNLNGADAATGDAVEVLRRVATAATGTARLVVSSRTPLFDAVKRGRFPDDVYYRLARQTLVVPPLRERAEDIDPLLDFFVTKYASQYNRPIAGADPEVRSLLRSYPFPGNVRELERIVSAAVLLERETVLTIKSLPYHVRVPESPRPNGTPRDSFYEVTAALARYDGDAAAAGRELGISPSVVVEIATAGGGPGPPPGTGGGAA